jgi:hypothetical protein
LLKVRECCLAAALAAEEEARQLVPRKGAMVP